MSLDTGTDHTQDQPHNGLECVKVQHHRYNKRQIEDVHDCQIFR